IFSQSGSEGMPEVMDTAFDACIGPQMIPAPSDVGCVACRIGRDRLPRREQIVFWSLGSSGHRIMPKEESSRNSGVWPAFQWQMVWQHSICESKALFVLRFLSGPLQQE